MACAGVYQSITSTVLISHGIKITEFANVIAYGLWSFERYQYSGYCHHLQCRRVSI